MKNDKDWFDLKEMGSIFGLKILFFIYALLGHRFLKWCLHIVIIYYYLTHRQVKKSIKNFQDIFNNYIKSIGHTPIKISPYWQMYSFGEMMLDKIAAWRGDISVDDLDFPNQKDIHDYMNKKTGLLFISSHFGNIDVCRAISQSYKDLNLNILIYTDNAKKFNSILNKINPKSQVNTILVKNFSMNQAIFLKEKVDQGHWIFIMGDRISLESKDRTFKFSFLGQSANFPIGPLILGDILEVPVFTMHSYRKGKKFKVNTKMISSGNHSSNKKREDRLLELGLAYTQELEFNVINNPRQWFNFYSFWKS